MAKMAEIITSEEKIMKAALREFAEYGFEGARVDRIAKKAKINKAMIYYHFKGKEALYEKILLDITGSLFTHIKGSVQGEGDAAEKLQHLISRYIEFLNGIDIDVIRTMVREIATGGKYFKKLVVPNLILPVISVVEPLFREAQSTGKISGVNPYYTFIQVIGSIVFFNIMRVTMSGTPVYDLVFSEGYAEKFRDNLIEILTNGIFKKGDKK